MSEATLAGKRRRILEFIAERIRDHGYPPSVREIGEAVGLTSSSTVHAHLKVLQREGYLERDAEKPRAIVVNFEPSTGAVMRVASGCARSPRGRRGCWHRRARRGVGRGGPPPSGRLHGRRRAVHAPGAGGFDDRGRASSPDDYVVVRRQPEAEPGEIVVAGIPDEEATVKVFKRRRGKVVLVPANPRLSEMEFRPDEVTIYGRVVTVVRRL